MTSLALAWVITTALRTRPNTDTEVQPMIFVLTGFVDACIALAIGAIFTAG